MTHFLNLAAALAVFISLGPPAHAQLSGPAIDSSVESLKVAAITGDGAGEELDFVARRKGQPTIFIFIQADKWDRPVARFLSVLDKDLPQTRDGAAIVAVWLTDDLEKSKEYLPLAQQSIRLNQTTLAVYFGDKNGPPAWNIDPGAHLTAVVADNDKVLATFAYRSLNETNVPEVLAKLRK